MSEHKSAGGWLALMRREGESIRIGNDVIVQVTRVRGDGRVYLAVQAPPEVPVHREEVYDDMAGGGGGVRSLARWPEAPPWDSPSPRFLCERARLVLRVMEDQTRAAGFTDLRTLMALAGREVPP